MSSADTALSSSTSLAEFDRTTSRWGQATMGAALLFSLSAPLYLVLTQDLGITGIVVLLTAVLSWFLRSRNVQTTPTTLVN